ncbi:MAG: DoxX family protein [Pseudomonadota bacterium]
MATRDVLLLTRLERFSAVGFLFLRALTGAFLIYGVMDNVISAERMDEFSAFLAANGFPAPNLMAPLSVYVQLLCGIALVLGFLTRWTGIVVAVHFVVAVIMVHWPQDFRGWWPAIVLVGIGFQFALTGAGRLSVDALIARKNDAAAATSTS